MAKFVVTNQIDDLCRALGQDPANARRVVVDLQAGCVGKVYVELFADDEKLRVAFGEIGIRIAGTDEE